MELINKITFTRYYNYSDEFLSFCKNNNVKVPNLNSIRGQVIALMTHSDNRNKFIYRELLDEFIKIVGYKSNDIIQSINKTSQWGLKSQTINRKYYTIPYPFVYIDIHLRKRDFSKLKNREQKIKLIKDYLIDNYINVPPELWEIGHRDPNDPDTLEEKLVYQPPIQGRFRDRFKYDEMGLTKTPTPQELKNNFDRYYSLAEQKEIYVILQKRLG